MKEEIYLFNENPANDSSPGRPMFPIARQLRYGPVLLVIVSMLIMTVVLIGFVFQREQTQILQFQTEHSRSTAAIFQERLNTLQHDLNSLANVQGLATLPTERQEAILARMVQSESAFEAFVILDENGRMITTVTREDGALLTNPANSPAFMTTMGQKSAATSAIEIRPDTGKPVIFLAIPMRDASDNMKGVLVAQVNLAFLQLLISQAEAAIARNIYIIDERNLTLVTGEKVFLPENESTLSFVRQVLLQEPFRPNAKEPFSIYRSLDGNLVLRTLAPVAGFNWQVVIEQPAAAAYAPIRSLLLIIGIMALIAAVWAAAIGAYFSRQIVLPLQQLTEMATRISEGDLEARVEVHNHNELGILAVTFNQMTRQLQESITELEQRVVERTRDLRRRSIQLQVAAEVARDATSAQHLEDLLNRAVDLVRERFGFYHAGLFLLDKQEEYVVLRAATGEVGHQMLAQKHKLKMGAKSIVAYVTGSGRPRIADDIHIDMMHYKNPLLPQTRSEMALPLRVNNTVIGALDVQSQQRAAFNEDDINILQTMADQLAVAIEKTRLFEQIQATLEERLRAIVANLPIILFALDKEGTITLAEGQGVDPAGPPADELVGQSVFEMYPGHPQIPREVRRALAGERVAPTIEFEDSAWDVRFIPVRESDNTLSGVIGAAMDITERRRAEEALQEKEAMLRQIIDLVPHMIFAKNRKGQFLLVNQAVADAYGTTVEALTGARHASFHTNEQELIHYLQDDLEVIDSGRPKVILQERFVDAAGQERILQTTKIPFTFAGLGGPAVLGISVDITELKQAEEAMRQAQKLESLGVLAGGVAHDFNNLLVGILGQTTLAMAKIGEEHAAHIHLQKAIAAAEQAARLAQQMLAYSGRGHFDIRPVDLNQLIRDHMHLFQTAVPKSTRLQLELAEPLPLIEADSGQIQQVILNLVTNAAEATRERAGLVTLATGIQTITENHTEYWQHTGDPLPSGEYIMLQVRDNGEGMDEQTLSKIFEPFFTTKEAGRGLGLAAVLGIIRGHKGGMWVTSEAGKGSQFTFLFPASATSSLVPTVEPSLHNTSNKQTGLVLVIDDEEPVREAVTDILGLEGIEVITAASGASGIDLYRNQASDINLVLLDLSMPGLNGEETYHELRKINPKVRTLLSSGYHESEATHRFKGQGLAGFLQKPYSATTLVKAVWHHINQSDYCESQ